MSASVVAGSGAPSATLSARGARPPASKISLQQRPRPRRDLSSLRQVGEQISGALAPPSPGAESVASASISGPALGVKQTPRESPSGEPDRTPRGDAPERGPTPRVRDGKESQDSVNEGEAFVEAFLKHFADISKAKTVLQQEVQDKIEEIERLELKGQTQEARLRDLESQRQRTADDASERNRQAREAAQQAARHEVEELEARLREAGLERDSAIAKASDLEARLDAHSDTSGASRQKALEMEVQLIRSRLERETDARRAAEHREEAARGQLETVQLELTRVQRVVRDAQRVAAEQKENAIFQQEVASDLQSRMRNTQLETEQRIRKERGKLEAVNRLESILPRHMLVKALV